MITGETVARRTAARPARRGAESQRIDTGGSETLGRLRRWLTDPRQALRDALGPEKRLRLRLLRRYREPGILVRSQHQIERAHLERLFSKYHERPLDLAHPTAFSEKIQWRKLFERRALYTRIADKIRVREFVAERVGEAYLVPLLAVADTVAELRLERLSLPLMVKPTHASGVTFQVRSAGDLDVDRMARRIDPLLRGPYGLTFVEWAYWNVPRRVMAERLLVRSDGRVPYDYKIHVFGDRARLVEVHVDRFGEHRYAVYDRDWRMTGVRYPEHDRTRLERPARLEEMLEVAETLGAGFGYVRVDLYNVDDRVYVGELTLYPNSGLLPKSEEWERRLGDMWQLPEPNGGNGRG